MYLFYVNWIRRPYQNLMQKWKKKWKADKMKGPFPYQGKITKEDLKLAEECIEEIERWRK